MGIVAAHLMKSIGPVSIIKDVSMEIGTGEFIALTGRSGSGKSTLLYLLSSLDFPTSGQVVIDGADMAHLDPETLHSFRNKNMGFVFQFPYLIPELTTLENVLMPTLKFRQREVFRSHALELIKHFGIMDKLKRFPRELSGGEQQRVAIARALVMNPIYLFADEPTGSLDSVNGNLVLDIIKQVNVNGTTVIMVTHDKEFARRAERIVELSDGRIISRT